MEFELKNIGLWPLFRITFFVSSIIFLLVLLILGNQFMAISNSLSGGMGGMEELSSGLTLSMILFASITNALFFSFLVTAGGALYNFFSKSFGGYTVNLDGEWELETIVEDEPASKIAAVPSDESNKEISEE